jgi:hypothetical protein
MSKKEHCLEHSYFDRSPGLFDRRHPHIDHSKAVKLHHCDLPDRDRHYRIVWNENFPDPLTMWCIHKTVRATAWRLMAG